MTKTEFLNTVAAQLRCKKVRPLISRELEQHILDQATAYEREGMDPEIAVDRAVKEMGDPVEIGVEMDRIHRPRMSWGIVALTALIALSCLFLWSVYLALPLGGEASGEDLVRAGLHKQLLHNLIGFPLMLLVCLVDYSFLGKYARPIAAAFLLFMYIGTSACMLSGHGSYWFLSSGIRAGAVALMWLYLPIYGALLYTYRGGGWLALGKLLLWALAGVLYLMWWASAFSSALALTFGLALLLSLAIGKDWYRIPKRVVLGSFWGIAAGLPLLLGILFGTGALSPEALFSRGAGYSYKTVRLLAFFTQGRIGGESSYQTVTARQILNDSRLLGSDAQAMLRAVDGMPGFLTDFSFVSLVAAFGILGGMLVVLLLLLLIGRIVYGSLKQKNQLGALVGCAAGISLFVQLLWSILINIGLFPTTSATLPFISIGGSGLCVGYILIGLALSVCRYQNILGETSGRSAEKAEKNGGFQIRIGRGVLTYERK